MRKILLFLTLGLVAITSLTLFVTKDRTLQKEAMPQDMSSGEAAIGGNFALTDQTGKTVHDTDFRGRLMLVFFGFTHCPDICPVSTATLSQVMGKLGEKADQVAPVFITVDPERDSPSVLKDYLANFDKHMIGLTGTPEQIRQVTELYKAYFAKINVPMDAEATEDHTADDDHEGHGHDHDHAMHDMHHEENYTVNHSGFIYLMGKDGKFLRLFPYNADVGEITRAVEHALEQ